jgi:hypothetical protein
MDGVSPYYLSVQESGLWNVVDASTGGPTEVMVEGKFYLLNNLPLSEAEQWLDRLNLIEQVPTSIRH